MAVRETTKKIWITTDGKPFETHSVAILHEAESQHREQVTAYLDHLQGQNKKTITDRAQAGRRNCIMGFLQWELSRKVLIETVKDEPEDGEENVQSVL